ncbi:PIN domain nuclease [Cellulomonas biazotea]|uniref:Ribonuclease VapC n=1 Tax=Cellulomonas biazotea TaxID=1709 RepID=A0A402DQN1_9CELL|nr:PIN domain nuclease [Cellulomonas biazotea]GCE76401.1 ribonuclease VapC2 [Cellulomonas biazotea]
MAVTGWLVDKSALVCLPFAVERDEWQARLERGLLRIAGVTRLEVGFSAISARVALEASSTPPISLMPVEHLTPGIEDRALEVQVLLAERGEHRAASIPDLLVAATAERLGLTVLAVDKDFDLIAEVTGQRVETLLFD